MNHLSLVFQIKIVLIRQVKTQNKNGSPRLASDAALPDDAAQVNMFQPPASPENPMLEEFYYASTNHNEATGHFRHAQKAGVVFCDDYLATERMEAGSLDQNLPGQLTGC